MLCPARAVVFHGVTLQSPAALFSREMWTRLTFGAWIAAGAACGLEVTGVGTPSPVLPPRDASVDAVSDTTIDAAAEHPTTCRDVLAKNPAATTGIYVVDPDGAALQAPFSVLCEMTTAGGGWTLVGRERAGETGNLRFLAVDSKNAADVASGAASGVFGRRFVGRYTQVWIAWDAESFIRFTLPPTYDLFSNVVDTSIGVADETTSDATLAGWFASGGGAQLCVASGSPTTSPGETSWALKPRDDSYNGCGCNDPAWVGRGAYYGGARAGQQTSCTGYGGGWAGVKNTGEPKGGVTPSYETRIWIR